MLEHYNVFNPKQAPAFRSGLVGEQDWQRVAPKAGRGIKLVGICNPNPVSKLVLKSLFSILSDYKSEKAEGATPRKVTTRRGAKCNTADFISVVPR